MATVSGSNLLSRESTVMMNASTEIRRAMTADAGGISRAVTRALRETNARDYPPHIIARLVASFSPERVAVQIASRIAYVALSEGVIVGTASLSDNVIKTVFVDPDHQGKGLGAKLMDIVERAARDRGIAVLSVPSSITALGFYARLGFVPVREEHHGDERTIIMTKSVAAFMRDGDEEIAT
jgi:predicted N-acetyltransferase YhbS